MSDLKTKRTKLERLEEGLTTLDDRVETITERREEITARLADLAVEGDPQGEGKSLRVEAADLDHETEELTMIRPVIVNRIQEAREELHRAAIEETIHRARKTAGGSVGEHACRLEVAEEYEEKARDARQKAEGLAERSRTLRDAVRAVGRLVGMETGNVRAIGGGRSAIDRFLQLGELRRAVANAVRILEREELLTDDARAAIETALEGVDAEEERERVAERNQARIRDQAEEAEAARDRVDAWLRRQLSDGAVTRSRLKERAKSEGIPLQRDAAEADLYGARRRLGVVPVQRREGDTRTSWWALPDNYDERFRPIDSGSRVPASEIFSGG